MAERLAKQNFFAYTPELSGESGKLLFWEGERRVSGVQRTRLTRTGSLMLPSPPTSPVLKDTSASSSKAGKPSFSIDRKMGKLIGVILAHFNKNELRNMPGFDLF